MKNDMKGLPNVRELKIIHYKQHYNWDCGISCVLMVLPQTKRQIFLDDLNIICKQEEFHKSTWTIDLCYLLKRFEVEHVFYTVTLGIHPGHREKHFYEKIVSKDEERVIRRFQEAAFKGISIKKASLTITSLLRHLSENGPIIILVDAVHLRCETCKLNRWTNEIQKCLPWVPSYHGHYIVLCGFNTNLGLVYYRNPALRDRICQITFQSLDKARRSCGTDEDVVLIFNLGS